ncbi:PREDICTED: protein RRNAD1 isoform X2 [Papilio xuthus]|uniref:Protein RRNAD1 isoform X2 n=1 Tax=Papilio xuthus TaxID=66420 RepID=A0AAJ6ZMT8_PAPXU|nr:PREDICTED: protein RRNAD1 isoform X2 [Papilio xuthus]
MVLQEDVQRKFEMTQKLMEIYEWLLNMYLLDFYVDQQWDTLPESWCESLQAMDPEDMGTLLSGAPTKHMLPLSFLSLVKCAHTLSISRERNINCKPKNLEEFPQSEIGNNPKLKNLFLKHVKLKKRHEINLMAEIVNETAKISNCGAVLDFGSGLGHLMRVLSYKYDLHTMGIECQSQLTEQARTFDLELEYTARKHLSEELMSKLKRPTHLNLTLTSPEQLLQLPLTANITEYGLVGLHPCGDLGPLLLKHFVNCERVKFICIVGCCYMKLSCDSEPYGYPMSEYVKKLGSKLSYNSREIACHAIETYSERLLKGQYDYLKIHAFRAALEKVLVEHDPALKHSPVRSIKHSNTMTFESAALSRLDVTLSDSAVCAGEAYLSQWRLVVLLYSLRLLLAPLAETLVLLDRMLYVLEHGLHCEIRPVFDPKISPRNHIIIGRRM